MNAQIPKKETGIGRGNCSSETCRAGCRTYLTTISAGMMNQAPFGLTVTSSDGLLEYVNPAFTSLFGYGRADLRDRATWFEKAFPDVVERGRMELLYREDTANSPETSLGCPRTTTICTVDGRNLPCELRMLSLPTGEHLVVYSSIAGASTSETADVPDRRIGDARWLSGSPQLEMTY